MSILLTTLFVYALGLLLTAVGSRLAGRCTTSVSYTHLADDAAPLVVQHGQVAVGVQHMAEMVAEHRLAGGAHRKRCV